jgi:diaminopimelate epimerase
VVIDFTKMNGAGNDFILIDNRSGGLALAPAQIARLCDRHRGVGADGVILLRPSNSNQADWAWDFYNSDGGSAEMCGNGSRCFARFVQRLTGMKGGFRFETRAGIVAAELQGESVTVHLTPPRDLRLREHVALKSGETELHSIDTGVPHAIIFVPNVEQALVQTTGAEVRFHAHFSPRGTNVNFVEQRSDNIIRVRTYERGVEGETLACGTGVTASALVAAELCGYNSPVRVQVRSGDTLEVRFKRPGKGFSEVTLSGPAEFVFDGRIDL